MFCYQENTRFSQALPCTKEVFWEMVRKPSTTWRIDARRAIMAAVEASKTQGVAALQTWLNNADYQKFLLKKQNLKKQAAKDLWARKTDAERLLAFAQEIKESLPAFIFSCREFDATETAGGRLFCHRRLAESHLNGLVMLDIDHVENPMQVFWKLREIQPLMARTMLVHLTSSQKGIRIVFKADAETGNLADNQIAFAQALGYKADESCIDATRNSFAPKEEDILFIDDEIFNYYNEAFDQRYSQLYREKKTQPLHHEFAAQAENPNSPQEPPLNSPQEPPLNSPPKIGGVPEGRGSMNKGLESMNKGQESMNKGLGSMNKELGSMTKGLGSMTNGQGSITWRGYAIQQIIDARYADRLPCAADTNRHAESLKLATDLLIMLDGDRQQVQQIVEAQPWVQEIIAERDENVAQTVASAAACLAEKEKKTSTPWPSKAMQEAICKVTGMNSGGEHEDLPPAMPKRLPQLIQLLVSRTPEVYRPAVAHAVFPSLAAHLWKVRFRYIDNVCHEATLMNVLMAGTGAGKDCISEPINHIMHDIRLRDDENLRREAEWKKQVNSRGANKDKQQRPEGLIIQEIDADVTNAAFVQRMAEADEHFLYVKLNEIDQFDALRGNGSRGGQQFQIMCLAFDPGNRYGQTRVGTQSVTAKVTIRFNWNAATTIQKGQRYFSRVLTDGPISRINFCTIPEREIGADMPVYGTYDSAFDEELRPYIERLTRASGEVECQGAYRLARRLKDECAEFARLSQSRVYENLSFRANVIAYLKACVLYVAGGYKWDKTIEDFIRWSLRYDLWCKMQFFGEAIEQANREGERESRPGVRNLLELLPDEFTLHDAELIRQSQGMQARGTRDMLYQWGHRGYVERIGGEASDNLTTDNYNQVKFRKLKFLSNESKAKLA